MTAQRDCLLGVDIGSSNMKVVLLNGQGTVLGSASKEFVTQYPHTDWSEQNPEDWYEALRYCAAQIFDAQRQDRGRLAAISITAAAHTPVLLDKDDRVLRPAILWTDRRSAAECDELNEKYGDTIFAIAYHRPSPTWTMPQLLWLKKNEPEVFEKTARLMVAKDYLRWRLTGIWDTDVVDAQGTMLYDYGKNEWSPELCAMIGWPMDRLPPVKDSLSVSGPIAARPARDLKLPEGIPVVIGGSDTANEDYGAGCIEHGQGLFKIATAGNANVMTNRPYPHPLVFNYKQIMPNLWYIAGGTLSGAQVHKWLRDQFFQELLGSDAEKNKAFATIDTLAEVIAPGSDGLLFHPYLMGEKTPYMDPFLRGDYCGITIRHTRAHFVRALYEGISFSLLDCKNVYKSMGLDWTEIRLIGGGAKSPLWRQILCDVVGQEILVPENTEAAFGTALVAGVGAGVFTDAADAVKKSVRIGLRHTPDMKNHERYQKMFELYLASQKLLVDINHRLHAFERGA